MRLSCLATLAAGLALLAAGCGDDDGEAAADAGQTDAGDAGAGAGECDPLAAMERPIALGEVIAAGRDTAGVVYALDHDASGELRAYVSEGEVLRRHRVLGSGEGTLPGVTFYDVDIEGEPPFSLYVEIPDDGELAITKLEPGRADPDAGAEGEALEVVASAELDRFTLRNLPGEISAEYYGAIEDSRRVLVVRPEDDFSYDDFRVFLGARERMLEREVTRVLRARDGGSTTIEIVLDGEPATLGFPITLVSGGFVPGPATLEQGGESLSIELLEARPAELAALTFECR